MERTIINVEELLSGDNIQEYQKLILKYMVENNNLHACILEKEFELQKNEDVLQNTKKLLDNKILIIKKKDEIIKKKNREIEVHLKSFRYRLGSCLINATRSFKGFILCPINIIRLFKQYKREK